MATRRIRRLLLIPTVLALLAAGCAAGGGSPAAGGGEGQGRPARVNLSLDWTPNPDHVGLYYAQQHGLFQRARLQVTMRAPSDPSAPIKLVGLNQVDLAISYQPDLFLASPKKLPVRAVAALVPVPLNSLIALGGSGVDSPAALRGRKIGITGIPTDDATLATLLRTGGLARRDVRTVNVGFNLVTSLLSHKVDAILGGYRNVEGIQIEQETGSRPVVLPVDRLGVPSYDELVVVANAKRLDSDPAYAATVRRFLEALRQGTQAAMADRDGAVATMEQVTSYKPPFLRASVPATLDLLRPPNGAPVGCMDPTAWRSYATWMHKTNLLPNPIDGASLMTNAYLPGNC
ncbi:MAG TPA: ABC transporter substrate-binding protein [Actinomycetota bacterium]|jgi:putative hydroxymethylpyrimidine transport system substrate-binding protein|nr:ABC transporter substrate-binding protein [Actinomycetota bacterium]